MCKIKHVYLASVISFFKPLRSVLNRLVIRYDFCWIVFEFDFILNGCLEAKNVQPENGIQRMSAHVQPLRSLSSLFVLEVCCLVVVSEVDLKQRWIDVGDSNVGSDNATNNASVGIGVTTERNRLSHGLEVELLTSIRLQIVGESAIFIHISSLKEIVE